MVGLGWVGLYIVMLSVNLSLFSCCGISEVLYTSFARSLSRSLSVSLLTFVSPPFSPSPSPSLSLSVSPSLFPSFSSF
ncbi:hypothetical protein BDV97DRAFT_342199 [Delphinella strobiligena]|nr:hypothetical protein BDV97DRAFT_342199 [Delphinella strobiligena]